MDMCVAWMCGIIQYGYNRSLAIFLVAFTKNQLRVPTPYQGK